jgi:transposase-like protein
MTIPTHRGISKDNLDTYLSLFQLQRNTNKLPTIEKIKTIVKT